MERYIKRKSSPSPDRRSASKKQVRYTSISEAMKVDESKLSTYQDFAVRFSEIADFVLNYLILVANKRRFRFLEVEFYWQSEAHPDPFPHGTETQATSGNWYFHKNGNQYRGGTYKGLDITIGNSLKELGGMLIRGLEDISTGDVYCGPCVCVDHLLSVLKVDSIKELVDDHMKGDLSISATNGHGLMYCEISEKGALHSPKRSSPFFDKAAKDKTDEEEEEEEAEVPKRSVYASGRVGLMPTVKAKVSRAMQLTFILAPHRFYVSHKKMTKGRYNSALWALYLGWDSSAVQRAVNCTPAMVEKAKKAYTDAYNAYSRKAGDKKPIVATPDDDDAEWVSLLKEFSGKLADDKLGQLQGALAAVGNFEWPKDLTILH